MRDLAGDELELVAIIDTYDQIKEEGNSYPDPTAFSCVEAYLVRLIRARGVVPVYKGFVYVPNSEGAIDRFPIEILAPLLQLQR